MDDVPRFYSRHFKQTLRELIEESMSRPVNEQISLLEELAVTRVTAGDACKLFDAAVGTEDTKSIQMATLVLRQALGEVRVMCEAAARVDALAKDKISVHSIDAVLRQVVRVAYNVFGEDDERVHAFAAALRDEIRVPGDASGTTITPDADAIDMDDTVPS